MNTASPSNLQNPPPNLTDAVRHQFTSSPNQFLRHTTFGLLRLVGVLFAILIPVLAVSVSQLRAMDKVSSRELTSMAIFFGGVLLVSGAGVAARYFGRVLPQQRQLNALLAELNEQ